MTFYPLATDSWDKREILAIEKIVKSRNFTMGEEVKKFESIIAYHFGRSYAVMVNSGSSANLLAIAALVYHPDISLQRGNNFIVPAVSWSTNYYPLSQYGIELRFVDIDIHTLNIDTSLIEKAITPTTKGIFAVNFLGNPCEFDKLQSLCDKHNLLLIEDNCEPLGATFHGKYAGSFGLCGTFSSFFSHHICTMEGGFIITDDIKMMHILTSLWAYGWVREQPKESHLLEGKDFDAFEKCFKFVLPGYNVRPLEISGALGIEQMKKLNLSVKERRKNAKIFTQLFSENLDILIQKEIGESSWFGFFLVLVGKLEGKREEIIALFAENIIEVCPIVGGNFTNNPVTQYLDHSFGSAPPNADYIDEHEFFIGNHHYYITPQLVKVRDLIKNFTL